MYTHYLFALFVFIGGIGLARRAWTERAERDHWRGLMLGAAAISAEGVALMLLSGPQLIRASMTCLGAWVLPVVWMWRDDQRGMIQ